MANVVANREEVVGWGEQKKIKSLITYDDGERYHHSSIGSSSLSGSSWRPLIAPEKNINGDDWACDRENPVSLRKTKESEQKC